jgi:hypothetical protein
MHLIHSALGPLQQNVAQTNQDPTELQVRYRAYLEACDKHRDTIADIQKYLPGWMPKFR